MVEDHIIHYEQLYLLINQENSLYLASQEQLKYNI